VAPLGPRAPSVVTWEPDGHFPFDFNSRRTEPLFAHAFTAPRLVAAEVIPVANVAVNATASSTLALTRALVTLNMVPRFASPSPPPAGPADKPLGEA
jgi:hypothetical protein